jgi:transposase
MQGGHDWQMERRERLGLAIAALSRIEQKGGIWIVPSQSGRGRYTVCPDPTNPHCTCPDHEETGLKCKHLWAVEYVTRREDGPDGSMTIEEIVKLTKVTSKTYPRNWAGYNMAATNEKNDFLVLAYDLCQNVADFPRGPGRPRLPLPELLFTVLTKVYTRDSARRNQSDLRDLCERGYLTAVPHFNSVLNCLGNPALSPILRNLITLSSLPLKAVEVDFAVDSTGFTSTRFLNWYDHKYRKGGHKREHDWVKAHAICGVKTNIVTACEIHGRDAGDTLYLSSLLGTTAQHFNVVEVSADKGYSSVKNHQAVAALGANPYIPFKGNATGSRPNLVWKNAFHYYHMHREKFLEHYHKRSNVETTFMMIKTIMGDHVHCTTEPAMSNEVYAKVLCHNIRCLIQSMYELEIAPELMAWATEGST